MLACVVPRLLDAEERRYQFIDQNGRIDDPMELYRQTRDLPRWDDKSKCEFTGAFVENPKLWHKIAPRVKVPRFTFSFKDGPVINLAVFEVLYLSSLVAYRLLEA